MEYREIGSTGIKLSAVGFGGMRIPSVDETEAIATVHRALEHGITFFETGNGYGGGSSERYLGKALKGKRDRVVMSNKTSAPNWDDPKKIRKNIEDSLKAEQTDYFDMFSFWGVNTMDHLAQISRPGIFDELVKAKKEGLIRCIGITTHAQPDEITTFAEQLPIECVTLKYNLLTRRMEKTIAALKEKNVGVVVMTPLAGGMIANPGEKIKAKLDGMGLDPAVLGLRYLTSNPGVTSAIAGMCHPVEVDRNVRAGAGPLTDSEAAAIAYIQDSLKSLGEKFCTQCGYCMPCPQGVAIPDIFRLWNIMRGYGADAYSRGEYWKMSEGMHWADYRGKAADACVACGICETKCPESLPIMEDLKTAHAAMVRKE